MQVRPLRSTPLLDAFVLDRAVGELMAVALADLELDGPDYAMLSAILLTPGTTATELAGRFGIPLTTMSDWLASAARRGWVVKERGRTDQRRQEVRLTRAGQRIHDRAYDAFGLGYVRVLAHLERDPDEVQAVLQDLMTAVRAAASELRQDRPSPR